MLLKHDFDRRRNVNEAQVSGKERPNSFVIGCTQNRWVSSPDDSSFPRDPQCGKPISVWTLEVKGSDLGQVEPTRGQLHSLWVRQCVLDGHSHVGQAKLRRMSAVDEFDERVNDAFGVDNHLDLLIRQTE
jgi:hypothetical protein